MRVLVLEDNPSDAELVLYSIKRSWSGFESLVVDNGEDFGKALKSYNPDIILSDFSLPNFDSIEALKMARAELPFVPFVLVTGTIPEKFAIRILKEGADDYILKSNLMRLPSSMENALKKRRAEREKARMAEQLLNSNSELNLFIYKATHDLRGPLASIKGLADLAGRERDEKHIRSYVGKISECATRLDETLIALIETMSIKNTDLKMEKIDFYSLLRGVMKKINHTQASGGVKFNLRVEGDKVFYSDQRIIDSILRNLIENGIQFQNHALAEPHVSVHITLSEKGAEITIRDNGIGMDQKMQGRIFEMFFRGNDRSMGPGLGLYMVKQGVQRLGGVIDVQSEKEEGTEVSIFIPASYQ